MIYADNAATTGLDPDAFEAMRPYLMENYANASQLYAFSRMPKKALEQARAVIAECIHASPQEIFFTSGGTEADNWAIKGSLNVRRRRKTVTDQIEHHAVLNTCAAIEKQGFPVSYLPVDSRGTVSPEALKRALTEETGLVSVMLVNNEIGTVEPVAELSAAAHEYGAVFHTDAVAALGHIPVDVRALNVDMLSASGHKFHAPKGAGFLYVKNGVGLAPYAHGGAQERGMRAGTENVPALVAMACALKKSCARMREVAGRLRRMEDIFIRTLNASGIKYIRNGAKEHVPGNINISIQNASGELLMHRLDLKGICISTGSACDSVQTQVSHVIRAIGVPDEYARGTVRITFGALNREEDAAEVAKALIDVLK